MATDLEDRHKLILSDGTKYIELEVDGDSAVKLRSDLLYAKRHMLAIEQMLPASVKQHQPGDQLDQLDYFLMVNSEQPLSVPQTTEEPEEEYVSGDTFVWTSKSTTLLCKLRLEMNQMFHGGPRSMKMGLWNKCAKTMRQNGFTGVTGESCRRKWHNMMMTYKRILESNNQGRSSWEFFNLVHAVMQQQATNDPSPSLIISTLSEPRKRRRHTLESGVIEDSTANGDLFEIPSISNLSENEESEFVTREHKSKNKNSDHFLKMVLSLRRDELDFQQRESDRKWEEKRQRRRDRLKFHEDKLKAIQTLTDVLQKLVDK